MKSRPRQLLVFKCSYKILYDTSFRITEPSGEGDVYVDSLRRHGESGLSGRSHSGALNGSMIGLKSVPRQAIHCRGVHAPARQVRHLCLGPNVAPQPVAPTSRPPSRQAGNAAARVRGLAIYHTAGPTHAWAEVLALRGGDSDGECGMTITPPVTLSHVGQVPCWA